jgi:hypothetical protein
MTCVKLVGVNVQQRHIDKARELLAGGEIRTVYCPVALALRELFGIAVVSRYVADIGRDRLLLVILPGIAAEWILNFDNNLPVKPFFFAVEVPPDTQVDTPPAIG